MRWIALAASFLAFDALAQAYPVKPVRVILRVAPGGLQDSLARAIAVDLTKFLGQPVIVENRPSAGGVAGAEFVARSAPDGYNIVQSDNIGFLFNEFVRTEKLPYELERDFSPVIVLASAKNMAVASLKAPVSTMRELVALAKQKPGFINYGSSGIGSSFHIDAEALSSESGIRMNHVPYKGGAPILQALMTNELDFALVGMTAAIPLIRQGRIKALAYGGLQRSALFPDVPTLSESGFKGFDSSAWWWWLVPAATPRAIIDKIAADTGRVLTTPEFRERHITAVGHEVVNAPGAKAWEMYNEDRRAFAARVKPLNLKLD
ncbi:MAG: Bug family tripartite tricarboxylate transporter substrate binding protein [Burkholderiales bacterium]